MSGTKYDLGNCECGKSAMHSIHTVCNMKIKYNECPDRITTHLCCSCYIKKGYSPVDWHPECMKIFKELYPKWKINE